MAGKWLPGQKRRWQRGHSMNWLVVMEDVFRDPPPDLLPGHRRQGLVAAAATAQGFEALGGEVEAVGDSPVVGSRDLAAVMNTRSGRCRCFRNSAG